MLKNALTHLRQGVLHEWVVAHTVSGLGRGGSLRLRAVEMAPHRFCCRAGNDRRQASTSASRMARMVPKAFFSSSRRLGPTPGMPSRAERRVLFSWLWW